MKSMPYSALVLELVHVFETSARTPSMMSYNADFGHSQYLGKNILICCLHYSNIFFEQAQQKFTY
jgi:hypothetical protein